MSEGQLSTSRPADEWFRPGRFALLLAAMVVVPFWNVLLGERTFAVRDFGLFSLPVANYFRDSFWRGEWPLWNPLSCLGTPFLAQLNTLTLYPPSLIYLLLPLSWALPFFCLLHLYLGGLGMYFLARRWTGSSLGGAVAGTIFAFNGLSLNFLMWPSHIATFALMPWVIFLTQQAWVTGGRKIIWATLAAAFEVLAGGPETILLTWIILFAVALAAIFHREQRGLLVARRFLAVGFLALGLAAAQLLPFVDLSLHSSRSSQFGNAAWSMPAWGWANFLVPLFHTSHWQQIVLQEHQDWTSSYYAGIGAVFLAVMALVRRGAWRVRILSAFLLLSLVLALGDHGVVFTAMQRALPFLGLFRYPVKFVLAAMFAFPLLAAAGVGASEERGNRSWSAEPICAAGMLALMAVILWFAHSAPEGNTPWSEIAENAAERAAFLLAIVGVIYLLVTRPEWRRSTALALLGVLWLDALTHEPWQNPTADPAIYQKDLGVKQADFKPFPVIAGQSRLMQSPYSVRQTVFHTMHDMRTNYLLERTVFQSDCNLLDGVPKVDGFFSLYLRDTDKVLSLFDTNAEANLTAFEDLMAVSQTIAPGKVFDWVARPNFVPWFTAGQAPIFADDATTLRALTDPKTDFRRSIYLPPEAQGTVTATANDSARFAVKLFSPQKLVIDVECSQPTMVSISQAWYHNWKATADGVAMPVWRANVGFQAVQAPVGQHEIVVFYDDRAFKLGGAISVACLLLCAVAFSILKPARAT